MQEGGAPGATILAAVAGCPEEFKEVEAYSPSLPCLSQRTKSKGSGMNKPGLQPWFCTLLPVFSLHEPQLYKMSFTVAVKIP